MADQSTFNLYIQFEFLHQGIKRIHHNISNLSLYVAGVFFCIFFKLIKVVVVGSSTFFLQFHPVVDVAVSDVFSLFFFLFIDGSKNRTLSQALRRGSLRHSIFCSRSSSRNIPFCFTDLIELYLISKRIVSSPTSYPCVSQ